MNEARKGDLSVLPKVDRIIDEVKRMRKNREQYL